MIAPVTSLGADLVGFTHTHIHVCTSSSYRVFTECYFLVKCRDSTDTPKGTKGEYNTTRD